MEENWITETCLTCHVQFKITAEHESQLKKSHKSFYCPSGHTQFYPGETKAEKLEKELEYKQNHIKRLYDQNEERLKTINVLKKQLKDATEKKVVKKTVKKEERRGRKCSLFDKSQRITKINNASIWQPIIDHLSEELPAGKFEIDSIEALINQFYNDKLKRSISENSVIKYAWAYKKHLLGAGLIVDLEDRTYQLKGGGESIKPDSPEKPPVKLSYLEKWLIKKMPRKPFDIEQFYNDYPKQRSHKKNTEAVILDLIKRHIITQVGPDRFKLNRIKQDDEVAT